MVEEVAFSIVAVAISGVAAVFVFLRWNHDTGVDLLREARRELLLEPGAHARVPVVPVHASQARLRNVLVEHGAVEGSVLASEDLSLAVSTGVEDAGDDGEAAEGESPAGFRVLHWTPLTELERFGPQRSRHYEPLEDRGSPFHAFVWEPETDFVKGVHVWVRNDGDREVTVRLRVAYVEHLTRLQQRRLEAEGEDVEW